MALFARDEEGQGAQPAAAASAAAVSDSNSSSLSIDSEVVICEREITLVDENIQRVESALEDKAEFMGMRGNPDRAALLRCLDALQREKSRQREKEAQLRDRRRQGLRPAPPSESSAPLELQLLRTSNAPLRSTWYVVALQFTAVSCCVYRLLVDSPRAMVTLDHADDAQGVGAEHAFCVGRLAANHRRASTPHSNSRFEPP